MLFNCNCYCWDKLILVLLWSIALDVALTGPPRNELSFWLPEPCFVLTTLTFPKLFYPFELAIGPFLPIDVGYCCMFMLYEYPLLFPIGC